MPLHWSLLFSNVQSGGFIINLMGVLSLQEVSISQSCVVASQELCVRKVEAKLIPPFIASKYAFLSMVNTESQSHFDFLNYKSFLINFNFLSS